MFNSRKAISLVEKKRVGNEKCGGKGGNKRGETMDSCNKKTEKKYPVKKYDKKPNENKMNINCDYKNSRAYCFPETKMKHARRDPSPSH